MILLRFWKESLLLLAVVALFGMWRAREHALVESGRNAERARVADSALSVLRVAQRKIDSVYVRDTLRFTRWRDSITIRHDTVLAHLTDTLLVKELILVQDSTIASCSDLFHSCQARALNLEATIVALDAKVRAIPSAVPRSCTSTGAVSLISGLLGGFAVSRLTR